ncbi:MAG TPA: hypothetical protein VMV49_17475 [Candidatus Deferrimicrobium sp.]|nr:hypothetical protein [Candidatus Deferrimicrobium sp.]
MKDLKVRYHPIISEHRIKALLEEYDSEKDECPFYLKGEQHFCLLDYNSVHIENCHGFCFHKGFCCEIINYFVFQQSNLHPEDAISSK